MAGEDDDLSVRIGLTEKKYLAALARIEAQSVRAANSTEKRFKASNRQVERSFDRAAKSGRGFSGGMRNVSQQLSQVAQQGAATGDYLRALAIQIPDMALGFGALGIAAGALAPILLTVAQSSGIFGEEAEDLSKTLERLDKAVSNFRTATESSHRGLYDLRGEFGELNEEAQAFFEIQREIAKIGAQQAFSDAVAGFAGTVGLGDALGLSVEQLAAPEEAMRAARAELDQLNASVGRLSDVEFAAAVRRTEELNGEIARLRSTGKAVEDVADQFGITTEQAGRFVILLQQIHAADGPQEQAEAAQRLAQYIFDATNGLADSSKETSDLYNRLLNVVKAGLDFASIDMASGVSAAANEAGRLADNLYRANQLQGAVAERAVRSGVRDGTIPPQALEDLPKDAGIQRQLDQTNQRVRLDRSKANRGAGGKRGGGATGASGAQRDFAREAARYIDQTRTAVEEYNAELAKLEELNRLGFFDGHPEAYSRAVAMVNEEFQRAQFGEVRGELESISQAIAENIGDWEDMGDAVRSVLKRMAADVLASGLTTLGSTGLSALSSGGGSGLLSGLGGLLSGFKGFFAEGGTLGAGEWGFAGEKGIEPVVGPSTILPNKVLSHAAPGRFLHEISITGAGNLGVLIRDQAGMVVAEKEAAIVKRSVAATDRAMRATGHFGGGRR